MAKHNVIWKSYGMLDLNEIEDYEKHARENLEANEVEDITEDKIQQEVYDNIDMFFEDELLNLSKKLPNNIIAIADLGLWNGRRQGYKVLGDNLNEVVSSTIGCDEKEVYCDAYNVRATGYHHDGRNHVLFREFREDRNIDNFLEKIYNNETISSSTLNYYTKSLRPYVQEVYGF
jgi:hypothetical protein